MTLLLSLKRFQTLFWCLYCWLWTCKCRLRCLPLCRKETLPWLLLKCSIWNFKKWGQLKFWALINFSKLDTEKIIKASNEWEMFYTRQIRFFFFSTISDKKLPQVILQCVFFLILALVFLKGSFRPPTFL